MRADAVISDDDILAEIPQVEGVRALTEEELGMISDPAREMTKPPPRKRIRERHHFLARLLASGHTQRAAATIANYNEVTVSILMQDTAFTLLVEHYRKNADAEFLDLQTKLYAISSEALDELDARLEEEPEKLTNGQLIELAKMGADRSGHGPTTTQNTNVNIGMADRLSRGRERVLEAKRAAAIAISSDAEIIEDL